MIDPVYRMGTENEFTQWHDEAKTFYQIPEEGKINVNAKSQKPEPYKQRTFAVAEPIVKPSTGEYVWNCTLYPTSIGSDLSKADYLKVLEDVDSNS